MVEDMNHSSLQLAEMVQMQDRAHVTQHEHVDI